MLRSANVAAIFESFVSNLNAAIKEKVTEAVSKATHDFLTGHVAQTVKAAAEKIPRKYRRRGKKVKGAAVKKVRLSKNGKRIGRPPKTM